VRWYLRYGLSYRDVEELLCERAWWITSPSTGGCCASRASSSRQPSLPAAAGRQVVRRRNVRQDLRAVDLPVPAIDQYGQVIDGMLSTRRDLSAVRAFFTRALAVGVTPTEVTTDRAPAYLGVLDEYVPAALRVIERYANNPIEADHGRLKAWLRPMRGLKRSRSSQTLAAGDAFVQNLRRGHYEIGTDEPAHDRLRIAFNALAASA
jgi:transposase, IS6 family